jgi:Na+/H+ antiporter NhaB
MMREFAIFLIILGIIFTSIGGIMDMIGKDNMVISKKHFWNDGTYVTVLAVALLLLQK